MKLTVLIDDKQNTFDIPNNVLQNGGDFFDKMDSDMDNGWQMSREWVDKPNMTQRCQIVADKILNTISSENETMLMLMAGYIVTRMPNVSKVIIDTSGEMQLTEFL